MKHTSRFLPALLLMLLSGCAAPKIEQRYTNVRPKVEPLSAEILQAMQPNSTELLNRGEAWNASTGKLLDSVTSK